MRRRTDERAESTDTGAFDRIAKLEKESAALKANVKRLEARGSDAKQQLKGCAIASRDYEEAIRFGNHAGFGGEFKKVLRCRQTLDAMIREAVTGGH